jgi:hypothetical protein
MAISGVVKSMGIAAKRTLAGGLVAAGLIGPGAAQSADWEYAASLYGWFPGLDISTGTPFGTLETSVSSKDVLSNLDMAFMATFEARNNKWGLLGDVFYSDLSASKPTPFGALFSEGLIATKLTIFSGYLTYRLYEATGVAIDGALGFRWVGLDMDVGLSAGTLPARSTSSSESWVDPVVGVRAIVDFNDKWFGSAFVDYGGTGSDEQTWQALATVGYRFNDAWSAQFGYRVMSLKHNVGGNATKIELPGFIIGATFRF